MRQNTNSPMAAISSFTVTPCNSGGTNVLMSFAITAFSFSSRFPATPLTSGDAERCADVGKGDWRPLAGDDSRLDSRLATRRGKDDDRCLASVPKRDNFESPEDARDDAATKFRT